MFQVEGRGKKGMIAELLTFLNHADVEEGTFAVGEISQKDVDDWLSNILKDDYKLTLTFWTHNEMVLSDENGEGFRIIFNGDCWSMDTLGGQKCKSKE